MKMARPEARHRQWNSAYQALNVSSALVSTGIVARDLDPARFQRFGDFADEVDVEHAIGMGRTGDADVIGESEPALERAGGDATVQVSLRRLFSGLAGRDVQRTFLDFDCSARRRQSQRRRSRCGRRFLRFFRCCKGG
jgi:hypothetical protein